MYLAPSESPFSFFNEEFCREVELKVHKYPLEKDTCAKLAKHHFTELWPTYKSEAHALRDSAYAKCKGVLG